MFLDLDGTLLDHEEHGVPASAIKALKQAEENGHEMIITTGRPPCLFYGIDEELGFNTYIAANGRVVVYKGELIHSEVIETDTIEELIKVMDHNKIDIAYEGMHGYKRRTSYSNLFQKFSDNFHLEIPELDPEYYKTNDIYQIAMFYDKKDFKKFEKIFPMLSFEFSCKYGIDVNNIGGLKEKGIKALMKHLNIKHEDVIAIGDGFNDVSMLKYANIGIAMGNASDFVKKSADFVTDHINEDGIYNAFKKLNLI